MEVHKPKPVHGWRDFLSEMSVIVLGILIALGGEQLVETLHWHREVGETEARLSRELGGNVAAAAARLRTMPCLEKRLDEIASRVDEAGRNGKLTPTGTLGKPVLFLWGHGTWDSTLASQTPAHFPAPRLANIARAYQFITRLEAINQRELEDWSELWAIVGPGRPFDGSSAQAARLAVSHARVLAREMGVMSVGLIQRVKALDLPVDKSVRARIDAQIRTPLSAYDVCQPIGEQIPPTYGQAPLGEASTGIESALKDAQQLGE